ncbi:threonine/serine exporter family protein [Clostridium perfringens]|nr:threonine/serine exporter family protein [Clostridium perfringens]
MDFNRIINLSTDLGTLMLENGAETYRVEETMSRICLAYGINKVDVFVIPTNIIITIKIDDNAISRTKRVTSRTINLDKISKLNNLSRDIAFNNVSIEDAEIALNKIDSEKVYSLKVKILGFLITASSFTLLFGGNIKDALASGFTGIVLCILSYFLNILKTNNFFINILSGALASLLAFFSIKLNLASNLNEIIIGSLMPLVPGLAITNSLRDIIAGDLVAGSAKFIEAFLIAVGIAIGSSGILSILINQYGGMSL